MSWKFAALLVSLLLFGWLERFYPFFKYRKSLFHQVSINLSWGVVNVLITSITTQVLVHQACNHPDWNGILRSLPNPWIALVLSIVLIDLYMYGWHRLMHVLPLGWYLHRVHHEDENMNISTSYRFHTLEVVLSQIPKIFLLWTFGVPLWAYLIYETVYSVELIFQHSNWALPYRIDRALSHVIVTPNFHRAHHSSQTEFIDINFSSFLSIWDRLFQSRRYPRNPQAIRLGVAESCPAAIALQK